MNRPQFNHLPEHLRTIVNAELDLDELRGNDFWTTPMTKEKLAPLSKEEIEMIADKLEKCTLS